MNEQEYHFDKLSEWQKGYVVAILKDMDAKMRTQLDYETQIAKAIRTILTGVVTDE